jgi:tetratricopeptide (TPR) repeat protein
MQLSRSLPTLNTDLSIIMSQPFMRLLYFVLAVVFCFEIPVPVLAQAPTGHLQQLEISPLKKGDFLLFSKKPADALKLFKELWREEPENGYAVRGIVRSYQALDQLSEADSFLSKYLEQYPQSSSAVYGLGYVFYLQGRFEEAHKKLLGAVNLNPDNALALNNLGAVLVELNQNESAVLKVREAIDRAPEELMFYRNLHMIYVRSGQPDKFEYEYRQLLSERSSQRAKSYGLILAQQLRQKSFKLYSEGKVEECIGTIAAMLEVYREIDHHPGVVAGLFSLAVLYDEKGEVEQAIKYYREVLKINPQHIQAQEKMRELRLKKE